MIRPTDLDSTLERAFRLAFFLHGDREIALQIAAAAMEKLEVAASAQHKRLYYLPGRPAAAANGFRNRVSLSEPHLLQRLVFIESEPYEKIRERNGIDREDALVHYLKHLIRITLKRNSFYVTLGLCRLLFSYTTSETMEIYQAVIQDPERAKSDYYYRSRKAALLQELRERFGDLLRVCRAAHGEERFELDEDQEGLAGLVEESLCAFTPWNTACTVPARWDPFTEGVPSLTSTARRAEDEVEIHRIHTIVHPDCFRRLAAALGLDAPDARLRIPRFFASGIGRGGGRNPPPLGEEGLRRIKGHLAEHSERRRKTACELLRILVDGEESARLDARAAGRASFAVEPGAELIEVRARDGQGEVVLATHLIGPARASIALEDGRQITFRVSGDADTGRSVEVHHRPAEARNPLAKIFERLAAATFGGSAPGLAPALAVLLLVLFAAGAWWLARWREPVGSSGASIVRKVPVEPPVPRPPVRDQPPVATPSEKIAAQAPPEPGPGESPRVPEIGDRDVLRSIEEPAGIATLAEASKLCVQTVGDEEAGREIARELAARLGEGGRLRMTEDVEEADACLKLAIERRGAARLSVVARIVNADGRMLWPPELPAGKTYEGSAGEVGAGIAGDVGEAAGASPGVQTPGYPGKTDP